MLVSPLGLLLKCANVNMCAMPGVLFPIFADVAHLQAADVTSHTLEGKWLRTTCTQALSCLVGLMDVAFDEIQFMVYELFELM